MKTRPGTAIYRISLLFLGGILSSCSSMEPAARDSLAKSSYLVVAKTNSGGNSDTGDRVLISLVGTRGHIKDHPLRPDGGRFGRGSVHQFEVPSSSNLGILKNIQLELRERNVINGKYDGWFFDFISIRGPEDRWYSIDGNMWLDEAAGRCLKTGNLKTRIMDDLEVQRLLREITVEFTP